jgi:integrase
MYKRGSKGLSEHRRQRLTGPWWGKVKLGENHVVQVRLCTDKDMAGRWLRDLQQAADRRRGNEIPEWDTLKRDGVPRRALESCGIVSVVAESRRKLWAAHVADYVGELKTGSLSAEYVANARRYLTSIGTACTWRVLTDVDRDAFQQHIDAIKAKGRSPRTINNVRSTLLSFLEWAVKLGRLDPHKLATVKRLDERTDRRRVRRSLSDAECVRLLAVADKRELCYRIGLSAGLRRRELGLLEWRDVRIDGDDAKRPYLLLRPEATKSKRADEVPLSGDLAARLRKARPVFVTPTAKVLKRVPTLRRWKADLQAAGIGYRDSQGRICGLHSMRVTLGTALERIGAPRAVRHWIMRHSDPSVSYQSYVDRECVDAWKVVNRLPTYTPDKPQQLRKTGTADVPDTTAHNCHPKRHPFGFPNGQNHALACMIGDTDASNGSGGELGENLRKTAEFRTARDRGRTCTPYNGN